MNAGTDASTQQRLVLVTGPSGAGRTTAIRALEDRRFEAIDNLPLVLIPRLLSGEDAGKPLAIGVDVRTRGFSVEALLETAAAMHADPGIDFSLLYLDCGEAALIRRFSETRRLHPMSPAEELEAAISQERNLLAPIRDRADVLIDTSETTIHELKSELGRWYGGGGARGLAVSVQSFSFKRGVPRGLDMMFDVRFLANPHWESRLRPLDGRDPGVGEYIMEDPRFAPFLQRLTELLLFLLPAYRDEGKSYLSIGIGCTGGRHRSVFLCETVAKRLDQSGWSVSIRHREMDREMERSGG